MSSLKGLLLTFCDFKKPQLPLKYGCKKMFLHLYSFPLFTTLSTCSHPFSTQPATSWSFCHSQDVSLHLCFLCLCSLLNFPDGDLAIAPRRAAQDVAILGRAEGLDAVRVGLQLLWHSVALWVQYQHLTSQLTVTLTSDTARAATANPDLRGGERQGNQGEVAMDRWWVKRGRKEKFEVFISCHIWHEHICTKQMNHCPYHSTL